MLDRSVRDLLDEFASSAPTPGGGSASALAGALGASLLLMVARMPKTRGGSGDERATLDRVAVDVARLRARLAALVDEDSAAYDAVVAAFRLPKATDEEKAARRAAVQAATRHATTTPLAVMEACAEALGMAGQIAACGNPNAASDVQVGMALLSAACRGAYENVAINLPGLSDETLRAELAGRARQILSSTTAVFS
jgi:formiminotetrahydrofolate cyclodeaminase